MAQASDGSAVWAIARDDGELVAFDADWNETGRLSLGVGIDTLVLAPDAKTLLVGNSIGGQVHVVDAPSLALLNTIEGLASPKASPSSLERGTHEELATAGAHRGAYLRRHSVRSRASVGAGVLGHA